MRIEISPEFRAGAPSFCGLAVMATVRNVPTPAALHAEIQKEIDHLISAYDTSTIKERSGIAATRAAYRALGKDPSRYRPSNEQLVRRVVQGKGLYTIDTLVDFGNLVSLTTGYSVGVLDRDKIAGDVLTLGVGRGEEPYEGIGRGMLNIECLPVYRDAAGGVATPTSDNVRTMVSAETTHVLILFNAYDGNEATLLQAEADTRRLLSQYAEATDFTVFRY